MMLYGSARAAMESMVLHSASELALKNIRVNAIRAGAVDTPMHERSIKNMTDESLKDFKKKHLLGFGKTSDIVSIVEFLLSQESRWITGTTINADGGYLSE
jgi:Dehydrogenases with different specificities (related to short-chain alcohol dehydrogenases)